METSVSASPHVEKLSGQEVTLYMAERNTQFSKSCIFTPNFHIKLRRPAELDHEPTRENLLLPRDHAEKVPELIINLTVKLKLRLRNSFSFTPRLLLPVCILVERMCSVKGNISTLIINFLSRIFLI